MNKRKCDSCLGDFEPDRFDQITGITLKFDAYDLPTCELYPLFDDGHICNECEKLTLNQIRKCLIEGRFEVTKERE